MQSLMGTIHLAGSGEQSYPVSIRRVPEMQQAASLDLDFFANSKLI
jgi:hypothetical protein